MAEIRKYVQKNPKCVQAFFWSGIGRLPDEIEKANEDFGFIIGPYHWSDGSEKDLTTPRRLRVILPDGSVTYLCPSNYAIVEGNRIVSVWGSAAFEREYEERNTD